MNSGGKCLHILSKSFDHKSLLLRYNPNTPINGRSNLITNKTPIRKPRKIGENTKNTREEKSPGVGISTSTKMADGGGGEERR